MLDKIYNWAHQLTSHPKERGEYSSGYWQDRLRSQALILCSRTGGRVLEIGCGEGLFLTRLKALHTDLEVWGIDNNETRLEEAKKKIKDRNLKQINLLKEDATCLTFSDEYFDVVVCINVIFNLESMDIAREVIFEMARVCKRGGRVILDFRNCINPLLYFKYKLAPLYDRTVKNLPLKIYSLRQLHAVLEEAGLRIINKIGIGFSVTRIAPVIILEAQKS